MQGVGDSVLMEVEGYQFLMARDDARHLGSALLSVVAAGGDVLDQVTEPASAQSDVPQ